MNIIFIIIIGLVSALLGVMIGLFIGGCGNQNKEIDAYMEGYHAAISDIETRKRVLK